MVDLEDIQVVSGPSEQRLNKRQLIDYREQRKDCLRWLLSVGKNPERADGYARQTVSNRGWRMDKFYRWVWDQEDRYTTDVTHDHADDWLQEQARRDVSDAHRSNCRKALLMLFKWREYEHGLDEYDPAFSFSTNNSAANPRDFLTMSERTAVREAFLEYGSVPSPHSVRGDEKERWRRYLAQRFEKPLSEVSEDDWDRANGWKIPSLVATSLDAGLRPIEVERAVPSWVDTENGVLRIPKDESSKGHENWIVGLRDSTARYLERWLQQRRTRSQYDDTDALWLTRRGNPYQSKALKGVLERLCDIADISIEDRSMSWYAIRHSTGTYMVREEDLAAAQAQLRHKSAETTMKYDQTPVEDRIDALNRMG